MLIICSCHLTVLAINPASTDYTLRKVMFLWWIPNLIYSGLLSIVTRPERGSIPSPIAVRYLTLYVIRKE